MAIGTLGTTSTTALPAITFNPVRGVGQGAGSSLLNAADLAGISQTITGDARFAATNPTGTLVTGSTHSNTTLDTLALIAGGPLASIQIGARVIGVGIPPGTFVVAKPTATSVTLSQSATTTAAAVRIGIVPPAPVGGTLTAEGLLHIPGGRGIVQVKPGDVVAVDNTGWPILLSAATIAYTGSLWAKA